MELTQDELRQIEEYLVERLPDLLRTDPKISVTIEGILAQHFPRRDEFVRLIEEMQALRQEMHERFEQVDRAILEGKQDIIQIRHRQEQITYRLDDREAWRWMTVGDLRDEKGVNLEAFFAAGLRYGLDDPDIAADKIRLRQRLVDTEGAVFPPGFAIEVDLYAEDGRLLVFAVRATARRSDLDFFYLQYLRQRGDQWLIHRPEREYPIWGIGQLSCSP